MIHDFSWMRIQDRPEKGSDPPFPNRSILPKATQPNPPLYRVRLFAPDPIAAKSRFWYFVSYYKKVNKTAGEVCIFNIKLVNNYWKRTVYTHFRSFPWKKSQRNRPPSSRTLASGCDTIRDPDRTTCIASTDPRTLRTPSPKPTETWVPGTELDPDLSKSFAYVFHTNAKAFLGFVLYTPCMFFWRFVFGLFFDGNFRKVSKKQV